MKYTNVELEKMMKALQMAFMPLTMKESTHEEKCIYCWKSGCNCHGNNVKNDPFINMSEEVVYTDEIILYA